MLKYTERNNNSRVEYCIERGEGAAGVGEGGLDGMDSAKTV